MFAFVAFVTITNLGLGFVLGSLLLRARDPHATVEFDRRQVSTQPGPTAATNDEARPNDETLDAELIEPVAESTEMGREDLAVRAPARFSAAEFWSDVGYKLQTTKERTAYARTAGDKRLAEEAAGQLLGYAQSWLQQLLQCLDGPAGAGERISDGVDIGHLEMFIAQLEATTTNLATIDWTDPIEAVSNSVDRETGLLLKNQRRVSSKAK